MMSTRKCPICGKPRQPEHTPFCSTRCRDRDLLRWFGEGYAIPGRAAANSDPDEREEGDDEPGAGGV